MERSLLEMSNEELWILFPIVLRSYDNAWSEWYIEEREKILQAIPAGSAVRINHIGSTAVPGLKAKPTVDILLEVRPDVDLKRFAKAMDNNTGYIYTPQDDQEHLVFVKGYTMSGFVDKVFHLHVRHAGDPDELYFRDYLLDNPDTAARYASLKNKLARQFKHDRDGYTSAKSDFIRSLTGHARLEYGTRYKI